MRIDVSNLTVVLENNPVLNNISFEICSADSIAIVGMSGVGKTTLLRCIAGLTTPTAGEIRIDGQHPRELYGNGQVSYLFQEPCLWKHLTVRKHLELTFSINGIKNDFTRIDSQLQAVGLSEAAHLFPHQLSVGMKARTAIARAFCLAPKVLLMDEPFAAIDPLRRTDLNRQVKTLQKQFRTTTIWVTHDIVESLQFASRVIALNSAKNGNYQIFDLEGLPRIEDNARLPYEVLDIRDQIISFIKSDTKFESSLSLTKEVSVESF